MEKKQTAVEFLMGKLFDPSQNVKEQLEWFEQAKAMHKEEMVNTWTEATAPTHEIGLSDTTYILAQIKKAEQYYNETFGGGDE